MAAVTLRPSGSAEETVHRDYAGADPNVNYAAVLILMNIGFG